MQWIKDYISGPTHKWWVDNVWKPSWTKFLTYVYGLPAAALAGIQTLGALAGDDQISQYMDKMHVPNWVPVGLAGLALVHYIAHGRK